MGVDATFVFAVVVAGISKVLVVAAVVTIVVDAVVIWAISVSVIILVSLVSVQGCGQPPYIFCTMALLPCLVAKPTATSNSWKIM